MDDEAVVPRAHAQPPSPVREETVVQEEGSLREAARSKKRARTVDQPVGHCAAPLSPARKVQKLSGQSVPPRLPSASEQGGAFLGVERNEVFARDLKAELNGKK